MKNCIIPSFALKWRRPGGAVFAWLFLAAAVFAPGAHAQPADLSNRPLATRPVAQVKPNLMFILDTSGSMTFNFMPDTMNKTNTYGMLASQCNGLAYNPNMVYSPPVYPSGGSYPDMLIDQARLDGWFYGSQFPDKTLNTPQNLTNDYYYTYSGGEPRMGWVYTQTGVVQNNFYNECLTLESNPSPNGVFTKVFITNATAAQKTNYANWYSYYRKRYMLMRTAVGRAMATLDDSFRVGYSSIAYRAAYKYAYHFKDIKDFDTNQKNDFFTDLYGNTPSGNTPLRGALAKAGRYFAKKAPEQSIDPVQYSCQRNYALLTTDGYWDAPSEGPIVGQYPYGPLDLTGLKTVGEQDGGEARPMKDAKATADTLADVAEYYYKTNLRTKSLNNCTSIDAPGQDLCKPNTVQPVQGDPATWQHMTTYTLGIGVNGVLPYDKNYLTASTGSYADLKSGVQDWPVPTGGATNVDDLWHAAVNGRGQYYMAMDSSALVDSLKGVLDSLKQVGGAASAASTDSLELVPGPNNQTYKASYTTETWTGDLQAYPVNGADASVGSTPLWSAQPKLDALPFASRKIKFLVGGVLKDFDYNNMTPTQQGYFNNFCSQASLPDQCANVGGLAFAEKTLANVGANLVNYLRGQRTYESAVAVASPGISATVAPLYRSRAHVLGDIVSGAPRPVGKPNLGYGDAGYTAFAQAQSTRQNVVYTAANDGMLHAFYADGPKGGEEMWAYVPGAVMPNLYKLADRGYAGKHQYSADGAPVITDVKIGKPTKSWKTILVAGLNAGGRGYYAVDVTDPANPQALWEFTDPNMGLTYGNPVVGKLADGTWVVALTSGYNNDSSVGGDGKGHLYILDATDGTLLMDLPTTAGTPANPSGLAKISAWVDDPADKTIMRIYGGDLKGNLWRFDLDGLLAPKKSAMLLAKLQATPGVPQSVTAPPELAVVAGKPMVIVATGRYLGISDVSDTGKQSIYAIKDPLTDVGWGDVHADTINFVKQTFTMNANGKASLTDAIADMNTQGGWWVDLAQPGERVTTALKLEAGALTVATSLPSSDACTLGGSSYTYFLDVANGGSLTADGFGGVMWSNNSLIAGMTWVKDISGQLKLIVQGTNGIITTETPPIPSIAAVGLAHRTSWRELAD